MPATFPDPSPPMQSQSQFPPQGQTFTVGGDAAPNGTGNGAGRQGGEKKQEQRLIVVSNRLPVTISKDKDGEYHFKVSCAGKGAGGGGCKMYGHGDGAREDAEADKTQVSMGSVEGRVAEVVIAERPRRYTPQ